MRRFFAYCVENLHRKSPEKIAEKWCDATVASNFRRKIHIASFFSTQHKNQNLLKTKIVRRKNDANLKLRQFLDAIFCVEQTTQINKDAIICVENSTQQFKDAIKLRRKIDAKINDANILRQKIDAICQNTKKY